MQCRVVRIEIVTIAGPGTDLTGPLPRNRNVHAFLRGMAELGSKPNWREGRAMARIDLVDLAHSYGGLDAAEAATAAEDQLAVPASGRQVAFEAECPFILTAMNSYSMERKIRTCEQIHLQSCSDAEQRTSDRLCCNRLPVTGSSG